MRQMGSVVAAAQSRLRLAAALERHVRELAEQVQMAREPGGLVEAEELPAAAVAHAEEREPRVMEQMGAVVGSSEAAVALQRVAQGAPAAPPWVHVTPAEAAAPSFQQAPLAWRVARRAAAPAFPGATGRGDAVGPLLQQAEAAAVQAHAHGALEALVHALALTGVGHSLR